MIVLVIALQQKRSDEEKEKGESAVHSIKRTQPGKTVPEAKPWKNARAPRHAHAKKERKVNRHDDGKKRPKIKENVRRSTLQRAKKCFLAQNIKLQHPS